MEIFRLKFKKLDSGSIRIFFQFLFLLFSSMRYTLKRILTFTLLIATVLILFRHLSTKEKVKYFNFLLLHSSFSFI